MKKFVYIALLFTVSQFAFSQRNIQSVIDGIIENMVYVEGGTSTLGATPEQGSDPYDCLLPAHSVTLSSFMICRYEVTQSEWEAVMGSNPSNFKGANRPVECVSWDDCQRFIKKLNASSIFKFRLPTEAEWEYAARGGRLSRGFKNAGDNKLKSVAWYSGNSDSRTHDVGTKLPNELGIYDMNGNVGELCSDNENYNESYGLFKSPPSNPNESYIVFRGGSWFSDAEDCRVASRIVIKHKTHDFLGLRLVLSE